MTEFRTEIRKVHIRPIVVEQTDWIPSAINRGMRHQQGGVHADCPFSMEDPAQFFPHHLGVGIIVEARL